MPREKKATESVTAETAPVAEVAPAAQAKKRAGRPRGSKNKPATARKPKAPKRYPASVKAKILSAAQGKPLAEAHKAALKAGYNGSAASLYQMIYNARKKSKRGRPKGAKKALVAVSTIRRGPGRPKSAAQLDGLGEIDQIVSRLVQSRVNAAARAAIAELEKLIK